MKKWNEANDKFTKNMNLEDFFKVRDLIEKKVLSLIDEIE